MTPDEDAHQPFPKAGARFHQSRHQVAKLRAPGLEPGTSSLSGTRSNLLSYARSNFCQRTRLVLLPLRVYFSYCIASRNTVKSRYSNRDKSCSYGGIDDIPEYKLRLLRKKT